MRCWLLRVGFILFCLLAFPERSPAPLIYTPGEGWRYESVGGGGWQKTRAKDQMEVAQSAFDKNNLSLAFKAARRVVNVWPFSDYAPQAQYLLARCYEAEHDDEKAFKAYQKLLVQYPKADNCDEILKRQFVIANRYLAGQWFRIAWGYIPFFPSMDKTIKLYEQIIKNGAYSEVGPQSQMNIGVANEKKLISDYPAAAAAYERAADRYHDQKLGVDALYREGLAFNKQAKTAEYDQSIAAQAIATFTDFMTLHAEDTRVPEARKLIESLKTEQARGSFDIAKYYEHHHRWEAAKIYYNDVLSKDPNSKYAESARRRFDAIIKRGH